MSVFTVFFYMGTKTTDVKSQHVRNSHEPKIKNPLSPKYSVKKSQFLIYSSNMTNDRLLALQLTFGVLIPSVV